MDFIPTPPKICLFHTHPLATIMGWGGGGGGGRKEGGGREGEEVGGRGRGGRGRKVGKGREVGNLYLSNVLSNVFVFHIGGCLLKHILRTTDSSREAGESGYSHQWSSSHPGGNGPHLQHEDTETNGFHASKNTQDFVQECDGEQQGVGEGS